jgi:predicted PurR-regulated permease PerM
MKNREMREKTFAMLFVVVAGILLVAFIFRFSDFMRFLKNISRAFLPVWAAFAIAFIASAPVKKLDALFARLFRGKKNLRVLRRVLSITICYLALALLVVAFFVLIVPQLVQSIKSLSGAASRAYQTYAADVIAFLVEHNIAGENAQNVIVTWEQLTSTAIDMGGKLLVGAASASVSITKNLFQWLLGLVVSIYMLFDKERLAAQCKKLCYAFLSVRVVNALITWTRKAETIFSGFVAGKLLETVIVGAITYVAMRTLRMEYSVFISVLVGVTNIIPIFGAWIGAIVGTAILLIINPLHALWFLILIIVIQQIDGNLIGPRILGNSTGLSSFWTIIALIVGGGFYGMLGMLLSIPVFALLYAIIRAVCDLRLRDRGLSVDLSAYADIAAPAEAESKDS